MTGEAYIPPAELRARLIALRPFRDELGRLMIAYRCSSVERRRLLEAAAALDDFAALCTGDRDLLRGGQG